MNEFGKLSVQINSYNEVELVYEDLLSRTDDLVLIFRDGRWVRQDWDYDNTTEDGDAEEVFFDVDLIEILRAMANEEGQFAIKDEDEED